MDQNNPLPALTQDEVRVAAWAEVRKALELQLAPLGQRALEALGPKLPMLIGQSMSALPGYFRPQLVPLSSAHRLPRCRDI
jgi:hypothetical protein